MSGRATLRDAVARYRAWDAAEAAMQASILAFIDQHADCLWRTQLAGHITASALVLNAAADAVLLIHHRKLDRWLQPGGHADGDADTLAVAQREVWEECGLETEPLQLEIFDLDIHLIPERGAEPQHDHHDLRYLLRPRSGTTLLLNHEVHAAEWVPLAEIHLRTQDRSVLRMIEKVVARQATEQHSR
jgi:8-oxo-dGTP pyrophosphatase MutT (NUDIX family)